jgi:hypothetical protein
MRRTASPSRPYGRYAVVLRPSLDRDAYIDAPSQDQEAPKQPKANAAVVLTGPAPSGMTCEISLKTDGFDSRQLHIKSVGQDVSSGQ